MKNRKYVLLLFLIFSIAGCKKGSVSDTFYETDLNRISADQLKKIKDSVEISNELIPQEEGDGLLDSLKKSK